ncbi:hypothetical protein K523DRAFT_247356, partial [Schizophyllum commune Tattone D]
RRLLGLNPSSICGVLFTETGLMPLRVRRVLLALRYLGYLLALPDDHFAKLAVEESFRLARSGQSSWVSDLRHVLACYLPLEHHSYDRLHDASALASIQTELVRAADNALLAELGAMSRLDLWNARVGGKVRQMRPYLATTVPAHRKALTRLLLSDHILAVEVLRRPARYRRAVLAREDRLCRLCRLHVEDEVHALLDCRGRLDLICMRRTLFEDMHRMKVRAPAFDGENWGRSFLCWLTGQKRDDVRAAWAHYVYRVLGVFEAVPIYVMDQYRLHSTTR